MSQLLQVIQLATKFAAAIKAKDWMTAATIFSQIVALLNPQPTPGPTPTPNPVFSSAAPTEDDLVAHAVACGCDAAEAQALVDSLK